MHDDRRRGVASVTLNRAAVNNAYNGDLIEAVIATLARLERDTVLRVEAAGDRIVDEAAARRRSAEAEEGITGFREKRGPR